MDVEIVNRSEMPAASFGRMSDGSSKYRFVLYTLDTETAVKITPNGSSRASIRTGIAWVARREKLRGHVRIVNGVIYAWVTRPEPKATRP